MGWTDASYFELKGQNLFEEVVNTVVTLIFFFGIGILSFSQGFAWMVILRAQDLMKQLCALHERILSLEILN